MLHISTEATGEIAKWNILQQQRWKRQSEINVQLNYKMRRHHSTGQLGIIYKASWTWTKTTNDLHLRQLLANSHDQLHQHLLTRGRENANCSILNMASSLHSATKCQINATNRINRLTTLNSPMSYKQSRNQTAPSPRMRPVRSAEMRKPYSTVS